MAIDAIYARQSVDKADSISIESQIEYCIYETRGMPYKTYCDKGYSGKNTDRPEFQKMLQDLRKGIIKRVICYKLDRCSRSILDFTRLMELFQKYNVEFVSCTEKFDTSTPMGRAMLNICIVFAQLERETIQQRIYDAYHSRCKHGFFMGGRVPFGFRLIPCQINGKKSAAYAPIPEQIQILKRMYGVYSRPTTSLSDVIQDLESACIRNPKRADGLWVRSHVGRMLKNPIYVRADETIYRYFLDRGASIYNDSASFVGYNGCYLYHKDKVANVVLAPHEGVVSSEIWLRCINKGLHTQLATTHRKSSSSWLCGKIKCMQCGYAAVVRTQRKNNGKIYRYLSCSKASGASKICTGIHGLTADDVEAHIEIQLQDFCCLLQKQWRDISLQKKKQIMNLLIQHISLSEDKIVVHWRV